MFFDNHRDACMRLEGTIITYRGKACTVASINENLTMFLVRLADGKEFNRVDQRDPEVVLRAPCLGYINTKKGAVFAMRTPARMWKQGLHMRSVRYKHQRFPMQVDNQDLSKCLDNEYPTLEGAKAGFTSTNPFDKNVPDSIAFSRRWAVSRAGQLLYKGNEVGELKGEPMLKDKFIWLAEDLQETLDANR